MCYNIIMSKLLEQAKEVSKNAYCKYSGFPVGAAVLVASGKIYTGCNVENASYPLCVCAERNAVAAAVAAGERELQTIAIYSPNLKNCVPCGACRQVLAEFGVKTIITGEKTYTLEELLPEGFCI